MRTKNISKMIKEISYWSVMITCLSVIAFSGTTLTLMVVKDKTTVELIEQVRSDIYDRSN